MKIFSAVLAVLLMFQVVRADDPSLSDVVRAVLHNVVNVLGDFVEQAEKDNEAASSNIEAASDAFLKLKVALAEKIFDGVTEQIGELLSQLEQNTTAAGEAIISCVRGEKSAAEETLDAIVTDIHTCEESKFKGLIDGQKVIVDALGVFQVALKKVDDDYESCIFGDLCLVQLLQGLQGLSDELSGVGDAAKALVDLLGDYGSQLAQCAITEESVLRKQAEDIFNDAASCIEQNING